MNTAPLLRTVTLPRIDEPAEPRPELSVQVFKARLSRVREHMRCCGLDAIALYGDREHFANLAWLTHYDPRFEEALLIVVPTGKPILFVGNEGMGYSQVARLNVERRLYQAFSLLGQPREKVRELSVLLREAGLADCNRVGVVGWKYFTKREFADAARVLDVPEFVGRSIRQAIRRGGTVTNETALFMDAETGLRSILEPEQIADFEWVATLNSAHLLRGIRALKPGLTEWQAFAHIRGAGLPYSCHPLCASGQNFLRAIMPSPTSRRLRLGDPILFTNTYQGSNTCRYGFLARNEKDLPRPMQNYVASVAAPYFSALATWYETIRVGATGDSLHRAVHDHLDPHGLVVSLNAGHQIAADEWTNSLVARGSTQAVRSGMYFQADFFPMRDGARHAAFAEDGLVIADASLRATLARRYPTLWRRVRARRRFMIDQLRIRIHEDVLPMSNFPAAVMPFLLSPRQCMTRSVVGNG